MNPTGFDWALCRSFLHVLRGGGLSAAARSLGLSHPAVRRHVESLEAQVGGALFTRSPTGLKPTPLAERLAPAAEAMEAAAAALAREAASESEAVEGVVRIAASEVMGVEVLPSMLARLRDSRPGLTFELVPSNAEEDMLRRDADVAVRMRRPRQSALTASRVALIPLGLYAHPAWVAAHGLPQDATALLATRGLVGQDRRSEVLHALGQHGVRAERKHFALMSDSDLAQLGAVRAAVGAGVVQAPLAARAPGLTRVLPAFGAELEVWLTTHPDMRRSPRIRVVLDHLTLELRHYASTSQGHAGEGLKGAPT